MRLWKDWEGDLWVQVSPGRVRPVISVKHAARIADDGVHGVSFEGTNCLYGPLIELDTTSSASRQHYIDTGHFLEMGEV